MAAPFSISRYYDAYASEIDYFSVTEAGDNSPVLFYTFSEIGTTKYSNYLWKEGDRIDNLALTYFSYPERWWIIAEFNPKIDDWFNIKPGTIIRIPRV